MDDDGGIDVDGCGSMEEAPTSVVEDLVPSLTPANMTQFLNNEAPAAKPVTKQKASAPMASLKGLRQADRKRKAPAAVAEREITSDDEIFVIDRIAGGSKVGSHSTPSYMVEWEGYDDTNWQGVVSPSVDDDSDYRGFAVQIIPMGSAREVCEQGLRPSHKAKLLVLGNLSASPEGNTAIRDGYSAKGGLHRLDLRSCMLDDEPKDWLLCRDRSQVLFTDAIVDWSMNDGLIEARKGWGEGKFFPLMEDTRSVLLHLGVTVMPGIDHAPSKLKRMLMEIAVFLDNPDIKTLPIMIGHALSARDSFLDGGLIRDCLVSFATLESKDIAELAAMAGDVAPDASAGGELQKLVY